MQFITEADLLKRIDEFCALHGMTDTKFSVLALNDFSFLEDVRNRARSPKLKTANKILKFMENYKPEK